MVIAGRPNGLDASKFTLRVYGERVWKKLHNPPLAHAVRSYDVERCQYPTDPASFQQAE